MADSAMNPDYIILVILVIAAVIAMGSGLMLVREAKKKWHER